MWQNADWQVVAAVGALAVSAVFVVLTVVNA